MINHIEGHNPTEYQPPADIWEDDWQFLVRVKTDFFAWAKTMMRRISDQKQARIDIIAMEQTIDDALHADAKRIQEFFDDGRTLPMSPIYAEWLRDSMPKRIVATNPATREAL